MLLFNINLDFAMRSTYFYLKIALMASFFFFFMKPVRVATHLRVRINECLLRCAL